MEEHKFWKSQAIKNYKLNNINNYSGPIENYKFNFSEDPIFISTDLSWYELDIEDEKDLNDLYIFLKSYYRDNKENKFKLHYTKELLKWLLLVPNYQKDLHLSLKYKNIIIATIIGIPRTINILDKNIFLIEINLLCIRDEFRKKRLSPLLIREISRRISKKNIWQAYYTNDLNLPNSLCEGTYYIRPLNIEKLLEIKYIYNPENIKLLEKPTKNLELLTNNKNEIKLCCKLLNKFLLNFKINLNISEKEFKYLFLPRENLIFSWILKNNGLITDFISFVNLSLIVNNNSKYSEIKEATLFYYFTNSITLTELMANSLYSLKKLNFDSVSCINQMNNNEFLEKLNFRLSNGNLNYYLYNWDCPKISIDNIGLVII